MYRVKPQVNMTYLSAENVKIDARLRCRDKKEIPRRERFTAGRLKPAAKPHVNMW